MYALKSSQKEALLCQLLSRDQSLTGEVGGKILKKSDGLNTGSIRESLLSNCFEFAYNEGLSYENVGEFMRFYHQLIKDSAVQELPISEAAALVKERTTKLAASRTFKDLFIVSAIEFISITFLQHYHLIVFALCYSRQQEIHVQKVLVEVAPYEVDKLKGGKQFDQWKLEGALQKEEEIFVEEEKLLQETMADTTKNMEDELEHYFASLSNLDEVNVNIVAEMIQNIVSKRGEITKTELEFAMDRSRALMTKNMALMTIQNDFKENLKNQQQQQTVIKPTSPPKRVPTSSPGKKK